MPTLPAENRNGRILQGKWGNDVRQAFLDRDCEYGLVESPVGIGGQFIDCFVYNASGTGGDATTQATWNYTVTSDEAGDAVLGTGIALECKRPVGPMLSAADGTPALCRYNSDGNLVLCKIFDEVIGSAVCEVA